MLSADDNHLVGNGTDATRLEFRAVDKYGASRPFYGGQVSFEIAGPGQIVGDNPFDWEPSGGVGAIWVKANKCRGGHIIVAASHPVLGKVSLKIEVSS